MAQIKRRASAEWTGSGKEGTGSLTTQSATLKDMPYGFNSRFGDGKGTNPEELIAAAHAGCFSMATAFQLAVRGIRPKACIVTHADHGAGGRRLEDRRGSPGAAGEGAGAGCAKFQELAAGAKANCPVSKVLNAEITLEATLG